MYEVTVEAGFSSGHYLREYYGKCENPHGHNYRVLVTLAGEELEPNGLLLDFKVLKDVLRPVVNYLDHQMINDLEPFTTVNPSAELFPSIWRAETPLRYPRPLSPITFTQLVLDRSAHIGKYLYLPS